MTIGELIFHLVEWADTLAHNHNIAPNWLCDLYDWLLFR